MWFNFHTHSTFCDGSVTLEAIVKAAKQTNLKVLGFSSHAPLPFFRKWCMKKENLPGYLNQIEVLRKAYPQIELYKGLEADYIPGVIMPSQFEKDLDFTIGSIHFVDELPDGTRWEIDGTHQHFLEGYNRIFKADIRATISRYFELTREMIRNSCPTIVGHLDKIKIQNINGTFYREEESWYRQEVKQTLRAIRSSDAIVEVNTRGLYKKKSLETYPGRWILEQLHELKIPVTLSSDAHHPAELTAGFSAAVTELMAIGFKKITILHNGSWKPYPFDQHGIII
jgi:histidinol-phosphatase (PHP family)